jgi:hypothetical protein
MKNVFNVVSDKDALFTQKGRKNTGVTVSVRV